MSQTKAQLISDLVQALNFTGTSSAPTNGVYLSAANTISLGINSAELLTVNGTRILTKSPSGTDTTVRFQHTGNSGYGDIILDRNVNAFIIDNDPSNASNNQSYFSVKNKGTINFYIKHDGNVGIGTTSPTNNLHLGASGADAKRSIKIDGTNGSSELQGIILESDGENSRFNIKTGTGGGTPSDKITIATATGKVGIGTISPDTLLDVSSSDDAVVRIQSEGSDATDDARLEIKTTNGTFTIQNDRSLGTSGALTFAGNTSDNLVIDHNTGNVGIGTSSPRRHFHIHNSASATVGMMLTNADTGETNDSQGFQFKVGSDKHAEISQQEDSYIQILTDGSNAMRITNDQKVGIGTTSPDTLFHLEATNTSVAVNNAIRISDTDTTVVLNQVCGRIEFETADSGNPGVNCQIDTIYSGNGGGSELQVRTGFAGSLVDAVRISDDGKVGVGLTNPDGMLHLKGSIPAIYLEDSDGTHGQAIIEQNGDNLKIRQDAGNASSGTGSNIIFEIDSAEHFKIDTTGSRASRRGVNFPNPNNTGSEITAAVFKLGSDNLQLQERYPNGAYADRCDLVIRTNSGYGGGESDKVRFRAGGGICFGTDTASANALDDYEEGSWTVAPTCQNGSVTLSSSVNECVYVKIGRLVQISGRIRFNTVSSQSGWIRFSLPFTNISSGPDQSALGQIPVNTHDINLNSAAMTTWFELSSGNAVGTLICQQDNGSWFSFDCADLKNNDNEYIAFSGTYQTDA